MKHKHHKKDSGLDKQQVDNDVVDSAETAFLELLGQDIDNNPERLTIATEADRAEIETLIGNVEVDNPYV
ncbi:hypothetical protein LRP52_43940 [Photobacterium sp. ZSDE20]|uniref:Uncharacterized protein n=1 Tax=Photobacterium pectinilyticum TaxID=2906793 RepID=A0ABT1NBG9_9GAMM|nr:hypothetical protein [Photobacterium sp. ZSDE20]MCQ1061031.1 hypothetical protein [Photobacterium sp. ZSDE20]MDD1829123.1 hypothetical protein [Photobacterium sp. ZSDE20]